MGILDQLHEIEIYILLNQIFSEEGQCRLPALRSFGFPSHRLVCFLRWIPFIVKIFLATLVALHFTPVSESVIQ